MTSAHHERIVRGSSTQEVPPTGATLAELGESRILSAFIPVITAHNESIARREKCRNGSTRLLVGPGDDCAVFAPLHRPTVYTTDTLTQGQDFLIPWSAGVASSGYDVGWKAATQNLADIAAMGAEPVSLLVSLSLPAHATYGWVENFARGLLGSITACRAQYCTVGGGDLGEADKISVTVTAVGEVPAQPVLRSGANPGDTIALAGQVGWADAGLRLLLQEDTLLPTEALEDSESVTVIQRAISAQLRPVTTVPAGLAAAEAKASAMMDISDGLVKDAYRLAVASGVDIVLNPQIIDNLATPLVPVSRIIMRNQRENPAANSAVSLAREHVLGGGEDHGLLACFPAGASLPEDFIPLGVCTPPAERAAQVFVGSRPAAIRGWEHYA